MNAGIRVRSAGRAHGVLLAIAVVVVAAGCSTTRPWINAPLDAAAAKLDVAAIANRDPSTLVAVTLSGGGARAAAFGYGVLKELRATRCCWHDRTSDLLSAVDLISGVSGGSIVAAYYAAFGVDHLDDFERDFLRQDFQGALWTLALKPSSLHNLTSPWFGRSQLLERRLEKLYRGMTFGDIARRPRHPQLVITATDLTLGLSFDFTAAQFELLCSDLYSVPLSFAVTASSAVPLLLTPMTLRNHGAHCPQAARSARIGIARADNYRDRQLREQAESYLDATTRPYVHLVDGGLSDNLGVRRLLERALTYGSIGATFSEVRLPPGSVSRLVLIIVNSERDPTEHIDASDRVPGTGAVLDTLLFGVGNRATAETEGFLMDAAREIRADLAAGRRERFAAFAPDAEIFVIPVNLRDATKDERPFLLHVPTAFSIGDAEVTRLIAAGRDVLRASPEFQSLRRSLGLPPLPGS